MPITQATDVPQPDEEKPRKKKKQPPAAQVVAATTGTTFRGTTESADARLFHVKQEARQLGLGRDLHLQSQAISDRATQLHPSLMEKNPSLAAELLLGPTPTAKLSKVSAAVYDGWTSYKVDLTSYNRQQEESQAMEPPAVAAGNLNTLALAANGIADAEQRTLYLTYLTNLAKLDPNTEEFRQGLDLQDEMLAGAKAGTLEPGQSTLQQVTGGVGQVVSGVFTAPVWAVSHVWDAAQSVLPDVVANPMQAAQNVVGTGLEYAGKGGQFLTRNVEGAVLSGLPGLGEASRAAGMTPDDLFTTWQEVEKGGHSPGSEFVAAELGTTADDPRYQGLFDATDLIDDLATQVVLGKALGELKTARTATVAGGGTKLGAEWVKSRAGEHVISAVDEVIKRNPVNTKAVLTDKFKNVNPSLANELARATTKDDIARVFEDHIDRTPEIELPKVQLELNSLRNDLEAYEGKKLTQPEFDRVQQMKASEVALEQRIADLNAHEVDWAFPKKSAVQAMMRGLPDTVVGRTINRIFGEGKAVDLSKLTDDVSPRDTKVYDPSKTVKPLDWASRNFDVLRKQFNIAKVPKELQRTVLSQMMEIRTPQDFYNWRIEIARAFEEGLTRGGKRVLTPEAQRAIRFSDSTLEERMQSPVEVKVTLPDGTEVTQLRNALEVDGSPLPSQPNEFIGHSSLPSMQVLQDASSTLRYADNWLKQHVGTPYDAVRLPAAYAKFFAFELPRLIIRPALLVTRIIPMGLKIQLDQALRLFLSDMSPFRRSKTGKVALDEAGIPVEADLVDILPDEQGILGIVANEMVSAETTTIRYSTKGLDINLRPRDAEMVARSRWDTLSHLSQDELAKKVAVYGPEGTLQYLLDHPDTRLGRWYSHDMKPLLDERGVTPEEWLHNKQVQLNQAAGGDAALREAIATGEWNVGRDVPTGAAIELQLRLEELAEARQAYATAEDPVMRQTLNLQVESLERTTDWLSRHNQTGRTINLRDREAVTGQVLDNWRDGTYEMPSEVLVKRRLAPLETTGQTRLERMREMAQKGNRVVYQGLRPLSKLDEKWTRGSAYHQSLEKVYTDLRNHGYDPKTALNIAQYRAAFIARDLLYDISARSSFDRSTKELFWFAPVWREQILTYLYKLPSQHYWPAGLFLEVAEAHTLLQGLKHLGILGEHEYWDSDTESNKKELVLHVPWASDFVAKVLDNSEAGGIRVGSLNPVTPAGSGLLPTLSPGAEAVLDWTANKVPKEWKPFFDSMAQLTEFDQDVDQGPSFVPNGIRAGVEFLGIHAPVDTFSVSDWKELKRKSTIQARKWAMSDLASDGIVPPSGEAASPDAMARYRALVDERAGHYRNTLALVHLVGAAASPGSLTTETGITRAGAAYYKWRDSLPEDMPSQEFFDANDAYLAEHPAAFPYFGTTHPGKYPNYNEDETLDPEVWYDRRIGSVHYWSDDAPSATSASSSVGAEASAPGFISVNQMSPRWKQKATVLYATQPLGEVSSYDIHNLRGDKHDDFTVTEEDLRNYNQEQADVLLPAFDGRDKLLAKFKQLEEATAQALKQFPNLDDAQTKRLYDLEAIMKANAASHYGDDGAKTLRLYNATPAEKLVHANYFSGNSGELLVGMAADIKRYAIAQGSSPQYAAESTGVLEKKVAFYDKLEMLRSVDPAFDREMRRAELALGRSDAPKGRVAAYEALFFSQPSNSYGYQGSIVQGLR